MLYNATLIDRPRLIEILRSVPEYRLTIISAPPGYGKTTLASQFARQAPCPVAWQSLEERQRDIPHLYAETISALQSVTPGISDLEIPPDFAPEDLVGLIADHLRSSLNGDLIYILDDVHHLTGAPAAESWLRHLVNLLPKQCHLMLLSRTLPDLPLLDYVVRHELLAMGLEDLRMSLAEIRNLASQRLGDDVSAEYLQTLETRLEGWPAGTALALYPLPKELERVLQRGHDGPEALFDGLADSMLGLQTPEIQEFLLVSSILRYLSPETCQTILETPHSEELLAEIQARNLFSTRTSMGLSYHLLFRSYLQRRFKASGSARFAELHGKAARYFEATANLDEAFPHYLEAGQPEGAASIAEQVAASYYAQGKLETMFSWRLALSSYAIQSANLLYWTALAYCDRYEYATGATLLEQAELLFRAQGDEANLANVALQRVTIALVQGNYQHALNCANDLMRQYPESVQVRLRALNLAGHAQLYLGQTETAVACFEEALPLYRAHMNAYGLSSVLQSLGMTYSRLGRLGDANACLQEVVALRRKLGGPRALAMALNNLGYYYHRSSHYDLALSTLQEGLALVARYPDARSESYLLWSLGDLKRDLGDFNEATNLYQSALGRLHDGEPPVRCSILTSLSTLNRWRGRWTEAAALGAEALQAADDHQLALEGCLARAALWIARAHLGMLAQAQQELEAISVDLRERGARYELMQVLGLNAEVMHMLGEQARGKQYLRAAIHLAEEIGTAQALAAAVQHDTWLATLVSEAQLDLGILVADLKQLRRRQSRQVSTVPARERLMQQIPYSLKVLTLGKESVVRDGKVVPGSAWRSETARELFYFLLFGGPQRREAIGLAFWPERSEAKVRSVFHTTLHLARQVLGADTLIYQDDLYLLHPDVKVWCDAHELEQLSVQARLLAIRDARAEDLWRKATALYAGDFLPTLDADWIVAYREKLRTFYLDALLGLAHCVSARSDAREALEHLRHALHVDPYREDVHRAVMACYAQSGERQRIIPHLRDLRKLLHKDLGMEPSPETLALADQLLK